MNKGAGAAVLIDCMAVMPCRGQSTEGLHHEDREGEEHTADDAATDGADVW